MPNTALEGRPRCIVVTGANGFLGSLLTQRLRLCGWNVVMLDLDETGSGDLRAGDIRDLEYLKNSIPPATDAVIHLAAVLSASCEIDPAAAYEVNVGGTLNLLRAVSERSPSAAVIFVSTIAVFSSETASEIALPRPTSVYGMSKAMAERLVADFDRRELIRGYTVRLPTIAVRPGPAGGAASSFVSTMVKEAIRGSDITVPLDASARVVISSARCAVENIRLMAEATLVDKARLSLPRTVHLPGVTEEVGGILRECQRISPRSAAVNVQWVPDRAVEAVVGCWPSRWQSVAAEKLGMVRDSSFGNIVAEFTDLIGLGG